MFFSPSLSFCVCRARLRRIDSFPSRNPTTVLSHVLKAELDKISSQIDKVPDGWLDYIPIQIYQSPLHYYRSFCCKLLFSLADLHCHAR